MREQPVSTPERGAWPGIPGQDPIPADRQAPGCPAAITQVLAVIGDTRRHVLISGGLLAVDLVGAASVASALLGRGGVVALGTVGLLTPVLLSWLVTAVLVLLAERPVTGALSELRRATGAPVDPSAPWSPLGVLPLAASALNWGHVVPLIAAANIQHARARLALAAAVITTAAFFLWVVISLAVSALA